MNWKGKVYDHFRVLFYAGRPGFFYVRNEDDAGKSGSGGRHCHAKAFEKTDPDAGEGIPGRNRYHGGGAVLHGGDSAFGGLCGCGILSLFDTVWVILGANIGTTVTSQLTAVDMGTLAPLMAFLGIILLLFSKKEKLLCMGGVLSGVGMMFLGLSMVEGAMAPLGEEKWFLALLVKCQSPLAGILAGTIFTALLQSSAASVGILQMLAKNGLIGIHQSIYMVFGQNMGTCFTALLASAGTSVNARRTAVLHLLINVLGTVTFLGAARFLPLAGWVSWLAPNDPARQIAHAHTLFNVISSLALLPLGAFLIKITKWLVPERK